MEAFDEASGRAELILSTGGLGPTSDDITKQTLADYFGSQLVVVPSVLENINSLLASRGVVMNERNQKQAELPDNCELLNNSAGTAQGMWFKKEGRDFIALPGVPFEMKAIFKEELEHRLKERFVLPFIHHITVLTHGIPESEMAGRIHDWETGLPELLRLAYLPSPGLLRLRITGRTTGDPEALKTIMETEVGKLKGLIGLNIFGYNDEKLEVIIKLLKTII
jgi:nicotinamide-nucleotide amidase